MSLLDKLKQAWRHAMLAHVPDHPAHGGNTGDTEWEPAEEHEEQPD